MTRDIQSTGPAGALERHGSWLLPLGLVGLLVVVVVPIAPAVLDVLISFNLALSLVVLLVALNISAPLGLSVLPSLLLLLTVYRLALNVASTRLILLHGWEGLSAAGRVIRSLRRASWWAATTAVGIVVFAILVIINFVVITKGAARVAEVSARFTLDALPGKQMSIDADLNAGDYRPGRGFPEPCQDPPEADFYGSMDGASKFVRGDAVAGLLILFINLIGGMLVGTLQHDLSINEAAQTYALLTIGDGLVARSTVAAAGHCGGHYRDPHVALRGHGHANDVPAAGRPAGAASGGRTAGGARPGARHAQPGLSADGRGLRRRRVDARAARRN